MTSDVRYASGEVPQVGDEVRCADEEIGESYFAPFVVAKIGPHEEAKFMEIEGDVLHDSDGSWVEAKDCALNCPRFDLSTLDTAGVFHHAQQPAPVETFVPTWGPELEYVANHGTVFTFLLDDKSEVAPIKLTCEFGDVWFSRDGSAAFGASWVIVSQRPRTPAPVETPAPSQPADVPQESAELTELRERLAGAERECSKRGEWLDEIGEIVGEGLWHEITDKLTARLSAAEAERDEARAEVERLKAELEREEREHGNTIDDRDQHEASINLICDALGMDEAEVAWSSHNDPPTNAVRRIEKLFDEVANWKSEAERNGLFEFRQVEEREAIKKAVGFEEIGPTLPEHCRLLAAELTTLRERLAAAEEERDEPKASFDLEDDGTPEYGTPAYELFDKAITWTVHQLKNVLGVKEWSTSGGGTDTLDGDLRMELNDLLKAAGRDDDSMEALRADLARAKDALIHIGSFFGCSAHLPWFSDDACDEVSALIDAYGGEKRYDLAFYETYCAQVIADIVTGALSASAGGEGAEKDGAK